jgi:cystathionine beta-lyase
MIDNTWASPFFFKPIEHGVDVSIQSGTKYVSGHSDLMLGSLTAGDETIFRKLKDAAGQFGSSAGPDDCYLALRGMRTMGVRMRRHRDSALAVAEWLRSRPEVSRVLHPGLPDHPGHDLWKRDFRGSSGLFGVLLQPVSEKAVAAMIEPMKLFKIGNSWGGYESLVAPADPTSLRTATRWDEAGTLIRIHVGLENVDDLIADLEEGFQRLREAQ